MVNGILVSVKLNPKCECSFMKVSSVVLKSRFSFYGHGINVGGVMYA